LLFKKFIIKFRVSIKINDFELNKNPKLIGFLSKQIEKLIRYKKDIELPYYNSYERKLIHEYVQNLKNPKITTKSI
jgi:predicted RNA-binding protein Jag